MNLTKPLAERIRDQLAHAGAALRRRGVSAADAEDWAQEALALAWQRTALAGDDVAVRAFVVRAALRLWRESSSRRREALAGLLRSARAAGDPGAALDTHRARRLVHQGLAGLKGIHRAAVLLRDIEGIPAAQAAQGLAVPLFTFYSRLRHGRLLLAARLRRLNAVQYPGALTFDRA